MLNSEDIRIGDLLYSSEFNDIGIILNIDSYNENSHQISFYHVLYLKHNSIETEFELCYDRTMNMLKVFDVPF